jgi:hypothetical protein
MERVMNNGDFVKMWLFVENQNMTKKRKPHKELITLNEQESEY